jgi:hypothetical protein
MSIRHRTFAHWRIAVLSVAAIALTSVGARVCVAQSPPKPSEPDAATEKELKDAEDLYILKDLPEPAEPEPKLDLGKVGKKGKLSLERMPLDQPDTYEGEPEARGRAGGVRLKIPLGKQAH